MGNSIRRFGLLSTVGAGEDEPFHYQLGRKVSVDLTERQFEKNSSGKWIDKWTMSYNVDRSTCSFTLSIGEEDGGAKGLLLQLISVIPAVSRGYSEHKFDLDVQTVTESDALANPKSIIDWRGLQNRNIQYGKQIHGGNVTNTCVFWFGSVEIGCLIVLENKRKIEEEGPYAVTLAHYIVTSAGVNDYSGNKVDVGLSVVVKIGASNGNLDITVEGPDQHPPLGLRYLFEEALRTRIWKPTMCPHCYHKLRGKMFWQSDSEDSDSVSMPLPPATPRNATGVSNGGRFKGNGNGNFMKTMLLFSKEDDNNYSTQDKTILGEDLCFLFVSRQEFVSVESNNVTYYCLLFLFSFSIINFCVVSHVSIFITQVAVTIYNYFGYPVL